MHLQLLLQRQRLTQRIISSRAHKCATLTLMLISTELFPRGGNDASILWVEPTMSIITLAQRLGIGLRLARLSTTLLKTPRRMQPEINTPVVYWSTMCSKPIILHTVPAMFLQRQLRRLPNRPNSLPLLLQRVQQQQLGQEACRTDGKRGIHRRAVLIMSITIHEQRRGWTLGDRRLSESWGQMDRDQVFSHKRSPNLDLYLRDGKCGLLPLPGYTLLTTTLRPLPGMIHVYHRLWMPMYRSTNVISEGNLFTSEVNLLCGHNPEIAR